MISVISICNAFVKYKFQNAENSIFIKVDKPNPFNTKNLGNFRFN